MDVKKKDVKKLKAPSPINPSQYRKLTKTELIKLGLGEKTERYVRRDLKRITKRTVSVSKRQYLKGQRAGQSNEAYAKAMGSGPMLKNYKTGSGGREIWSMPLTKVGFDRRLKKGLAYHATTTPRPYGFVVLHYSDGQSYTSTQRFLSAITWENSVVDQTEMFNSRYGADRTVSAIKTIELWIKYK